MQEYIVCIFVGKEAFSFIHSFIHSWLVKGYFRYKTITSQNVPSET